MKRGIDISKWQGNVDFHAVKNSGIEFVIFREGYRKAVDPKFLEYINGAKSAGLVILGVYHFMYSKSVEEAVAEAQSTIANVKAAELDPDKIYVFSDFEYDTIDDAKEKGVIITKNDVNTYVQAFCNEIKRLGYKPAIYTNLDYYKHYYTQDTLSMCPIWLADYTGGPDFSCIVQQYTSKGQVPGIGGNVDMNYYFGEFKMDEEIKYSRQKVVALARSWIGKNESDGSFKSIIDIYNSYEGTLPRGIKMQYDWAWCACTWSALAVALGYTDVMPIEISCENLIKRAQEMGVWVEDDAYRPLPGDAVLYDWQDDGVGDDIAWPDHVGVVDSISGNTIVVIEGNKSNAVGTRNLKVNGRYIRGFITPKFLDEEVDPIITPTKSIDEVAAEVLQGIWGNGVARKEALIAAGYSYDEVQGKVNELVAARNKEKVLFAACRVILGEYGNGEARKAAITKLGLDYVHVQTLVNEIIGLSKG